MVNVARKCLLIMVLSAILIGSITGLATPACAQSTPDAFEVRFDGFVKSYNGTPIDDALIYLYGQNVYSIKGTRSNSSGYYLLEAVIDESPVSLYVLSPSITREVNFMPETTEVYVEQNLSKQVNFTLSPSATVFLRGRLTSIESTNSMEDYSFKIINPTNGSTLTFGGYDLVFGSSWGRARASQLVSFKR